MFVWNDVQKREVVDLHHVDPDRIVVTGAQVFDDWFEKRPTTTRDAVLRTCGSASLIARSCCMSAPRYWKGAQPEAAFVLRWARHLRESAHLALRECGILVRPHFKRGEEWRDIDWRGLDNIVCWPPTGDVPVDVRSKGDYFDSLYHASATVGLNTSAMIEAAILGRPVHTVLLPEFRDSQEGTVHFRYLLEGSDALLRATRTLDEHAREVAATLDGRCADPERSARFVRASVRSRPR